jgi:hypothetical protein
MLSLLLGLSLAVATDSKELVTCKFLDEFYDYKTSQTEQLDYPEDTMYIELEEVELIAMSPEFLPEDEIDLLPDHMECTCDFTGESKPWLKDIHT